MVWNKNQSFFQLNPWMPALFLQALIGLSVFSDPARAEHRFIEPRIGDLPIDRCEDSGNLITRCRPEVQQRIADFFCTHKGYPQGAAQFTLKFVGPLPQSVVMFRDGSPPKFVVHRPHMEASGGIDVFFFIACRTPFGSPRFLTERTPKMTGGQRIDKCINNHPDFDLFNRCSRNAQKIATDTFCRIFKSSEEAVDWEFEVDVGIHSIYDHQLRGFGNMPGGEAIKNLTCKSSPPPIPDSLRRFRERTPVRPFRR